MRRLTNAVRHYAWGSRTSIASLQHRPVPSPAPEAELWMGAHPSAPSLLSDVDGADGGTADGTVGGMGGGTAGGTVALPDVIARDPVRMLGQAGLDRFGARLPYLLKLLAAAAPLSLQAHPDAEQAAAGYAAEEAAGLSHDDPARNYVDASHKPELLVAMDDFDSLCGFRDPGQSAAQLESLAVPALAPVILALRTGGEAQRLRGAVELLMAWPPEHRAGLVEAVSASPHPLARHLGQCYPGDVGVVVALLLNQVRLRPGDAVFMPAGNLHAYLGGLGVEVMAASDNVLRGGLTPKRVDAAELLRVLHYEVLADPVMRPVTLAPGLETWPAPVVEFTLTRAQTGAAGRAPGPITLPGGGARILCCVRGVARLRTGARPGAGADGAAGPEVLDIGSGYSAFVAATEPAVEVAGDGVIVFQVASPG